MRTADAVVSGVVLIVAAAVVALSILGGVFLLAFGPCAAPRCDGDAAFASVVGGLAVATVAGLGGLAATVRRIARRRVGWPFAVVTLVVCGVAVACGWWIYLNATRG